MDYDRMNPGLDLDSMHSEYFHPLSKAAGRLAVGLALITRLPSLIGTKSRGC